MNKKPTNLDLLHAIESIQEGIGVLHSDVGTLKSDVGTLKSDVGTLKSDVGTLKSDVGTLKEGMREHSEAIGSLQEMIQEFATHTDERFDRVECRVTKIEATMVTKDYLDNKFADESLRYGGPIRKTNERVDLLTDALVAERLLSSKAAQVVAAASPYARKH